MPNNSGSVAIPVERSCLRAVCPAVWADGTTFHTSIGSERAVGGHLGRLPAA